MAELFLPGESKPCMAVSHEFHDEVPVVVHRSPFATDTRVTSVRHGATIGEIVIGAGLPAEVQSHVRAFVGDEEVPRGVWHLVRPHAGRHVYIRVTPGKSGGKNILSSLLMLVVVVGAAFFAPMVTGALFPGLTGSALTLTTSLVRAGLSLVGMMAVSALIKPPSQNGEIASQRQLLSGVRNQLAPYATLPRVYGRRRVYPLQAAHPYTEAEGKNRYLRVLLAVGLGPAKISEIRIGDTPIEAYDAIQVETREGWHADHAQFGKLPLDGTSYDFTSGIDTWSVTNGTADVFEGHLRVTPSGVNVPILLSPTVSIDGATNRFIRARVRRIGSGPWRGRFYYATAGHSFTGLYYCDIPDPGLAVGEWGWVEWDMFNLNAGGDDWKTNTITRLRFEAVGDGATVYEIDQVVIGARRAADTDQTLFTMSVHEESFSVLLDDGGTIEGPWETRFTEPDCAEISVDVTFPYGLAGFKDDGGTKEITIEAEVQYRVAGSVGAWTSVTWAGHDEADGTQTDGKLTCKDKSSTAVTRGGRWICPSVDQYEVRMRRITPLKTPENRNAQRAEWTALRSIKRENPVAQPGMALIALRMKATDQLNGLPDTINCIVESYAPQWNGAEWLWELNRNPAWAYADTMRRRATTRVIGDSRIDTAALKSWAADCADNAPNATEARWSMDGTIEGGSIHAALRLIASHGRGSFSIRDGRYSVTQDKAQTVPVQHITPRNSFGYSGSKAFVDLPHALKVQFVNAENGYQEDEVIVYADGYSEANASKFESIEFPACTSATMAWREGRYYLAVGRLRPEEHQVSMDIENLRCTIGDYVMFAHDVLSIGVAFVRISGLVTSAGNTTGFVLDTVVPREAGTQYVIRVRRSDGSSQLLPLVVKTGAQDETDTVTLITPIATASGPQIGDLAIYGELDLEAAPMMVKRIEPGPNLTAKLTLVDAQPGVWTADTGAIPAFKTYVSDTTPPTHKSPPEPTFTVVSDESVLEVRPDGSLQERIAVVLGAVSSSRVRATDYEVQYRLTGSASWYQAIVAKIGVKTTFISPVRQGDLYDVRVKTISATGVDSAWVTVTSHEVIGKTTPPADVAGFIGVGGVDGAQLTWQPNTEIDVVAYTVKLGTDWDTAETISAKVRGTSLFVALDTSKPQRFMIRALDAGGLLSLNAATVTVSVTTPDDVQTFTAYPQEDAIRFKWTEVEGRSIRYEIRAGDSWSSGQRIAQASGDTITVKLPARLSAVSNFWIKAFSAANVYSVTALLTVVDQDPIVNRNVVLTDDFSSDTWAGVMSGFDLHGTGSTSYLTVSKADDGMSVSRADLYRQINLPATFYARNWLDLHFASVVGASQSWDASTVIWDDAGALAWEGSLDQGSGCDVRAYIATAGAAIPPDLIEYFALDGTTTGTAATTPSTATSLVYGALHGGQGLNCQSSGALAYTRAVPAVFTAMLDFRYLGDRGSYAQFMLGIPADPMTDSSTTAPGDFDLIKFTGTNTLAVTYIGGLGVFRLSHTGQADIDLSVGLEIGDLLSFGVSQSATTRTFVIYNHRTAVTATAEAELVAPAAFTGFTVLAMSKAPGVSGNIELRNTAFSMTKLASQLPVRSPYGYADYRELVAGDYRYQDAIVWMCAQVADRALDITFTEAFLSVDVPDKVQKGTVAITTAGLDVTFASAFFAAPHMHVTQTGGTTLAVPKVTNVSATGFTVRLFNAASPATAVAGTISYTATGY